MVSKPKFVFSPADLVNEVAAIQGDRTWVSATTHEGGTYLVVARENNLIIMEEK